MFFAATVPKGNHSFPLVLYSTMYSLQFTSLVVFQDSEALPPTGMALNDSNLTGTGPDEGVTNIEMFALSTLPFAALYIPVLITPPHPLARIISSRYQPSTFPVKSVTCLNRILMGVVPKEERSRMDWI